MIILNEPIVILFALIAVIVWILFSAVKKRSPLRVGLDAAFIVYCSIVVIILYFPLNINYDTPFSLSSLHMNWIPFLDVYHCVVRDRSSSGLLNISYNMIGNFLLFMPLSGYITWIRIDKKIQNLWIVLCLSGCAEIVQLLIIILGKTQNRIIDITDLLLNVCGAFISLLMFHRVFSRIKLHSNLQKEQ